MFVLSFCRPLMGRCFVLTDVVFEALSGGHFSSTTVTQLGLPESISTHYIKHIKQLALRSAPL